MKEESHNPWTDPELEARIVALVLGEASDFERDELNRLIAERPELAAFKEQALRMHGLLRDVATGESVAEDDDWKLPAEKRSAVLAVIGGAAEERPANQVVAKSAEERRSGKGNLLWNLAKIAAVVGVVGFFGSMAIPEFFNIGSPRSTRMRMLASNETHTRDSVDGLEPFLGEASAPSGESSVMDGAEINSADEAYFSKAVAEREHVKNSKKALSAIRDTLEPDAVLPSPYYLADDVQYVPAVPEVKVPRESATPRGTRAEETRNRAPTAGVNGPGPGLSTQTVDRPAMIADYEADWSDRPDVDGSRPADSQPNVPNSGNGELSFPMFAGPVRSTVSVPAGGTILLGGVKRLEEGRTEHGVSGKPTVSSPAAIRGYGEPESGGETQGVASGRKAALGLGDRSVLDGKSESPPNLAVQVLGLQGVLPKNLIQGDREGQEPNISRGQRRSRGGTTLRFDAIDSLAGGKDEEINGIVPDGETSAGSGGTAQASEPGKDISAEHESGEVAGRELDAWRKTRELAGAEPSQPTMAGMGRWERRMGSQDNSGRGASESKSLDTRKLAISLPSPATKPMSWSEDVKSNENLTVAESRKEEVAKESFNVLSEDDIAIHNGRAPDNSASYSLQIPEAVTGAAIGQPPSKLEAGPSMQDNRWGYARTDQPATTTRRNDTHAIEKRVKDSLGKLSALNELYKNTESADDVLADDYNENVTRSRHRPQAELRDEQEELLRQRGRLAISGRNQWYGYVPPMLEGNSESMKTWVTKSTAPAGLKEKTAEDEVFSTFSLHVSDVSFKLAQAALAHGEWPEAAKVRIEEFINAFDYGDPMPSQSERVSCRLEQSIHPFLQQRNLLRISMRTAAAGRSSNTPLRLTLLLDNSGSMERIDRQQTVRRAFALLAQQLTPIDQVTLISFARQPRLLADKVSGAQSHQLVQLIAGLPSEGGTNIEAALQLAFEKAKEQQVDDAQNRIILLTDGAVNLGDANPESLSRIITTMRGAGIAFDAAGISAEGLNDEVLEALTRKGDGRYYLLDSLEAADDGFARQIAGALRPSAKNVKVQIEFNPKRVGRYKLLGFEKHRLKQEDFRNDKVDAAEMAAEEAGVAVYQFEAKPDGQGDVGSVSVRFRDLSTGQMIEDRWPIPYQANAPRPDQAAPSMRIATSAAMLAAKLRGEPLGEAVDLKTLSDLIAGLPDRDRDVDRVQQLQRMIQQARQVGGK